MPAFKTVISSKWFLLVAGLIIGALLVLAIRFFSYQPDLIHYHANFAVYINGERQKFEGEKYYEETAGMACTVEQVDTPSERAHMHDNVSDVVHVEDRLVTWGNFMQNINWGLGDDYLKTDTELFTPSGSRAFTFILNGQIVPSIANTVINDKDRVLISYGTVTDDTTAQYNSIDDTAHVYNDKKDPAGCSGSQQVTFEDRLNHIFK